MRALINLLRAGGATLATVGVALAVVPPSTHSASVAPASTAPGSLPASSGIDADSLTVEIIVASIFSPDRTPPATRYTPAGAPGDSSGMASMTGEPTGMITVPGFEPLLFGTMVRPTGSFALVQFSMTDAAPRLVRAGDRTGDWRVESIAPREVVVTGPSGRLVLRLPTEEARP